MKSKGNHPPDASQTFYVDIPTEDCIDDDSGAWHNVGAFDTEAAALAFAGQHFGADARGRVLLLPSQIDRRRDRLEMASTEMVALLRDELAALRIWQSARNSVGGLALPDDVWDGMTISIAKIEATLRKAGISDPVRTRPIPGSVGQQKDDHGKR
jgi:hypothetical protein